MKHLKSFFTSVYSLLILPLLLVLLTEFLDRGGHATITLLWGRDHLRELILNYLLVFGLLLFVTALIGRTVISFWIVTLVLMVLGLVSGVKYKILGLPLLPWDLVLSGETSDMVQYLKNIVSPMLIAGIVGFIVLGIVLFRFVPRFNAVFGWKSRLALLAVSVFVVLTAYYDKPFAVKKALKIDTIPWDQAENYRKNGFLAASMMNLDLVFIKEPVDYNEKNMDAILASIPRRTDVQTDVKPNVIVMLSESFWDPTIIKNVTFNQDPVPFLHSLQQTQTSGWMHTSQFGGGTANVEFEVLSGNTMRFAPQGSLPYIQYVNHEMDSLASILTRQGYTATSVNPFHNWFFNSRTVYQNFGFSRFISSEFFDTVPEEGHFLPDTDVSKIIIEESEKSAGPDMIFANTMENHFPYYGGKFKDNPFKVSGDMPDETRGMLETLAKGINGADRSLQMLVEHYSKKNEPTIILFFGDHLPSLGNEFKAYRDTNYLLENDPDSLNKLYRTPFVIWNNYLPQQKQSLEINASFLGPYLLNMAKLPGTPYTDYLFDLSKKHPILPPKNHYASYNLTDADVKNYELLQYDAMFGKGYLFKEFKDKIINKNYELGYGPMKIERAEAVNGEGAAEGDRKLRLAGKNFKPSCVVYLNDKPLSTKFDAGGELTATVPASVAKKAGAKNVQVKIKDSQDVVIAESEKFDAGPALNTNP